MPEAAPDRPSLPLLPRKDHQHDHGRTQTLRRDRLARRRRQEGAGDGLRHLCRRLPHGGEKEAEILASELRMAATKDGRKVRVEHTSAIRQCEWEYLDLIAEQVADTDLVVSMACASASRAWPRSSPQGRRAGREHQHARHAAGARRVARALRGLWRVRDRRDRRYLPGGPLQQEPHERSLRRSHEGKCEVTTPAKEEIDCAWHLIWERLKAQGREEMMYVNRPPRTGARALPAVRGRWCGRRRSRYEQRRIQAGSNLEKVLGEGKFAVTGECGPPKSATAA